MPAEQISQVKRAFGAGAGEVLSVTSFAADAGVELKTRWPPLISGEELRLLVDFIEKSSGVDDVNDDTESGGVGGACKMTSSSARDRHLMLRSSTPHSSVQDSVMGYFLEAMSADSRGLKVSGISGVETNDWSASSSEVTKASCSLNASTSLLYLSFSVT